MKSTYKLLPQARKHRLVISELPDEVLVYDQENNQAYCLNHTAAFVWQHADGQTPVSEIAHRLQKHLRAPIDESIIWFALETLEKNNLLEYRPPAPTIFARMNRRQLIALTGKSAAAAIPLVFAITAPLPVSAASGSANLANGAACSANNQCASNVCFNNACQPSNLSNGAACFTNAQCTTNFCNNGTCATPAGGGGGCVLYDTPITTADGHTIRARDVVAGQLLLGVNCINGETIAGRVKHVMEKTTSEIYSLIAENGAVVSCSPSHDLIEGFGDTHGKRAELFRRGDALLVFDNESQKIVETKTAAIDRVKLYQPVLMFEMDTAEHTFISGGILSHNVFKF